MPPIKSINEPRAPLQPDVNVPPILTQAVGEPPKPTTTYFTNERIVSMVIYRDSLAVATERGVYMFDLLDQVFKPVEFKIVEEQSE